MIVEPTMQKAISDRLAYRVGPEHEGLPVPRGRRFLLTTFLRQKK